MPPKSQGWLRQVCLRGSGTDKRLREFQEKGVEPSNWKAGSRHLTHVAFLCPRQPNLWGFISWLSRKRRGNRWCRRLRAFLQRPWKGSRAQNVGRLPQTLLSPQALTLLMPPPTPLRAPKRTWLICTQKESHSGLAVTMKPERLGRKLRSYTLMPSAHCECLGSGHPLSFLSHSTSMKDSPLLPSPGNHLLGGKRWGAEDRMGNSGFASP